MTYCDQASWQSRIAAKPIQGVFGFLLGGLIWFAIPSTMATTTGLAYLALSTENNTHMLTHGQIDAGNFNLIKMLRMIKNLVSQADSLLLLTLFESDIITRR